MKIKGTITPDIAHYVTGYDFDVRTTPHSINLTFDNGHVKTRLVCYKLGNNKFEVEVIEDPLHLFPSGLDKGDVMSTSEIANVMIRQALKKKEMQESVTQALETKKKRKFYNVTGMEDGKLTGNEVDGASVTCSVKFVPFGDNYELALSSLDYVPERNAVLELENGFMIPDRNLESLFQALNRQEDLDFYQLFDILAKNVPEDTLKRVIKKSSYNGEDLYSIDVDNLFNVKARDFGIIQYDPYNHGWIWQPTNADKLNLSIKDVITVIQYAKRSSEMYPNDDSGKVTQTAYRLFEKMKNNT